MSMHAMPHVKSYNLPSMNGGNEVTKSSHYVNQQINWANKRYSYINLAETEIDSYTTLQGTDLSKDNYEQLRLNS